ncbi:hypothetical protein Xen7305DRAFT_00027930 [Xenococcus sp. PCC 7305]|uniref:hypothetical protein n=1 Tax=Xenococcus sp. PCC 7305 TaxID=102125 RepID=UPI0002ACA32B|nr:hypothetical protein [Xenococcus sp. PCC 7305]ELS03074.1 hypothetical protein Xen7305DRAFT_00027930 [Xenococcus sp. PCC 7305]
MKRIHLGGRVAIKNPSLLGTVITMVILLAASSNTLAQDIVKKITLDGQISPNPMLIDGTSGGQIEAIEVVNIKETSTGPCNGLVEQQPNHILILNTFFEFLKIEVESSIDTTILVQGPGGIWCNDDYNNINPALEGQWQQGKYKLWVGSYESTPNNYRIRITGSNP